MQQPMLTQMKDSYLIFKEKFLSWYQSLIEMLPNFVVAIVLLLLFYGLAKLTKRVLNRTLNKLIHNRAVSRLIISIVYITIIIIGLFIALEVLNLDKTVTSLLAGVGVISLALGLAFQDAAANLFAGIVLAVRSPIRVDDIVEFDEHLGTITAIDLRTTTILTPQGQNIIIPNRNIFQNPYKHYTINGVRRIDLEVGISYKDDLDKVESVTLEAIKSIEILLENKPVNLFFSEFGDSSINFVVQYWIKFGKINDFLYAQSEGIKRIKKAYDQSGISIPFPIRTIDFSIHSEENKQVFRRITQ